MPPDKQVPDSIGELLSKLRRELRYLRRQAGEPSIREIAKRTNLISHTTVGLVLRCERNPRWSHLEPVVKALGGNPADFRNLWIETLNAVDPLEAAAVTAHDVQAPQQRQREVEIRIDHPPVMYGVDLCLCIETGSSSDDELKDMLDLASNLPHAVASRLLSDGHGIGRLRVRYILFGTEINAPNSNYDSGFLLSDTSRINLLGHAPRKSPFNWRAAEALQAAINIDWTSAYQDVRHVVALWATSLLPADDEIISRLKDTWDKGTASLSRTGRRLIIFAPDGGGWTTIANSFDCALHHSSHGGADLTEKDFYAIVDAIAQDI